MLSVLPKLTSRAKKSALIPLTLSGFGGGLDAVRDDITMEPRYQPGNENFRRTASGSQRLRYGSNWIADVKSAVTGTILNTEYFAGTIICVTTTGQIAAVDDLGVVTKIWDSAIAALLPGTPAGWSSGLTTITFVSFKAQLIIHNGVDKPVTISSSHVVTYLQDLASGSNVHVPIGKYGCVVSNYHCVAGIPAAPTLIYVSSRGTAGTFPLDAPPNDSISIDVGAYAPSGAPEIRGVAGFRSFLIVFFQSTSLVVKLGVYNTAATPVHVPEFPDSMPFVGLLGQRCFTQVENDLRFAGIHGVSDAKRELISGLVNAEPLSSIVEPLYKRSLGELTDTEMLQQCFTVYDSLTHDLLVFIPGGTVFVYSADDKLRYRAWSTYKDLTWTCGCRSFLGRLFFAVGTRVFQMGNGIFAGENYAADRMNDRDNNWAPVTLYAIGALIRDTVTNQSYTCTVQHISGSVSFSQDRTDQALAPKWTLYTGLDINFTLELPWVAGRDRMQVKLNKYIKIASKGTAKFTVKAYVDNLYKDPDGIVIYDPAIQMEFIGNDARGFGYDAGPYGGGRRSNDPRLFKFPVKFESIKIICTGSDHRPLELINVSFLYKRMRYRR